MTTSHQSATLTGGSGLVDHRRSCRHPGSSESGGGEGCPRVCVRVVNAHGCEGGSASPSLDQAEFERGFREDVRADRPHVFTPEQCEQFNDVRRGRSGPGLCPQARRSGLRVRCGLVGEECCGVASGRRGARTESTQPRMPAIRSRISRSAPTALFGGAPADRSYAVCRGASFQQ